MLFSLRACSTASFPRFLADIQAGAWIRSSRRMLPSAVQSSKLSRSKSSVFIFTSLQGSSGSKVASPNEMQSVSDLQSKIKAHTHEAGSDTSKDVWVYRNHLMLLNDARLGQNDVIPD